MLFLTDMSSCAVGASEIQWYNDANNNNPLPALASTSASNMTHLACPTVPRPLPAPAVIVTGSQQSGHVTWPSTKAHNPNNTSCPKCKSGENIDSQPQMRHKTTVSNDKFSLV
jgi:hypothetical protein